MLNKAKKRSKVPPGNLQMKRPRPSKSPPGGFKIELRGSNMASWRLLRARLVTVGPRWPPRLLRNRPWAAVLRRSWRRGVPGRPPEALGEAPGGYFGRLFWRSGAGHNFADICILELRMSLGSFFFLDAPGGEANFENHEHPLVFVLLFCISARPNEYQP